MRVDTKKRRQIKIYDSDEIILSLFARGIVPIIPPKMSKKSQRSYDKDIHKKRHVIENTFLKMNGMAFPFHSIPQKCSLLCLSIPCPLHLSSLLPDFDDAFWVD
ncbi:MAG: hypothetical protein LBD40_04045 [Puniceicoccales bacterium]|jgi:hypothetical protein|nr:hypothetical protein [Puniceicoccales bacterium]